MKINDMKRLFTLIAVLVVSAIYAQTPKKMVLIPDYDIKFDRVVDVNNISRDTLQILSPYQRRSGDIFVIGNFNRVNVIRPMINFPQCNADNNNPEYVKTTQFNPQKSLQEILRNE